MFRSALLVTMIVAWIPGAAAEGFAEARELYDSICSKCHGVIAGDPVAWTADNLYRQTVVMPLGPNLSNIIGRPAGVMDGFVYSNAFKEMAVNPWIWDVETLDLWLTDSQAFVRNSTMYLKLDADVRQKVIGYLEAFAPYEGAN